MNSTTTTAGSHKSLSLGFRFNLVAYLLIHVMAALILLMGLYYFKQIENFLELFEKLIGYDIKDMIFGIYVYLISSALCFLFAAWGLWLMLQKQSIGLKIYFTCLIVLEPLLSLIFGGVAVITFLGSCIWYYWIWRYRKELLIESNVFFAFSYVKETFVYLKSFTGKVVIK